MTLKDLLDPPVEAFDHAVCLRRFRRGETVLDFELGAKPVELVLARGGALTQTEEAVSELLPVARREEALFFRLWPLA